MVMAKFQKIILLSLVVLTASCSSFHMSEYLKGDSHEVGPFFALWSRNLDPNYDTGNLPIALQSPLIHEGLLFIGSNKGEMNAYDVSNGREVWKSQENGDFHARPMIYKDQLIYGNSLGRVFSRNLYTGELKFSVDLDSAVESQGVVADGRLIFHTRGHKIFSLDVETGKILWAYRRSVPYLTTVQRVSRPLVYKGKIIVGFADGVAAALSLEEGVLLWEQKLSIGSKFVDVDADPIIFSGKLVMGSREGNLSVLNVDNGNVIREFEDAIGRTPLIYQDKLYVMTIDGRLMVFDNSFRELENTLVDPAGLSNIVPWKQGWFATTLGRDVYYLDAKFQKLKTKELGHVSSAVFGEVEVSEGKLAFITSRNRLYILGSPYSE